ncbi:MAG: hypothetical protein AAB091_06545 [Elusimicrobiota bacterium]
MRNVFSKKSKAGIVLGFLTALALDHQSWAAEVKLSGLIFGQYGQYLSRYDSAGAEVKNRGDFTITRIYMTGEAKFSDALKGKTVLEGNTSAGNPVYLKNAFMEYAFCSMASGVFGLIGTPWNGFEEGIWGRRFVQKVHADQEGLLASVDKGVGLLGKLPGGFGEYHATYVNGEGITSAEKTGLNGRHKDAMVRVSVSPMPEGPLSGLRVHAYAQKGKIADGDFQKRDTYVGAVSQKTDRYHAMASFIQSKKGSGAVDVKKAGFSVHGALNFDRGFSVFGRYDGYDPNKDADDDSYRRGTVGADYKLADGVRVAVSDQMLTYQTETTVMKNENQLLFQFEAKF